MLVWQRPRSKGSRDLRQALEQVGTSWVGQQNKKSEGAVEIGPVRSGGLEGGPAVNSEADSGLSTSLSL